MEVASILQMGKNYCVGGSSRGSNNYVEIQNIFMKFRDYCRNLKIDEAIIENVRCHSVLITQDLESTYTYDKRIGQLLSFMRQNPEIVIINVDKSVDVAILLKKDYHEKLSELFDKNTNFEKLKKFNLETDLKAFRKILKDNLGGYVNSKTMTYLSPNSTTSIACGLLKLHKPEKSLRPICTGYNAIFANSQKSLKKFIDPILQECTFLIDSPAKFKERLIQDTPKYKVNY